MGASTYRRSVGRRSQLPAWTPANSLDTTTRYVEVPHLGLHLPTEDITIEFHARFTDLRQAAVFTLADNGGTNRVLAHLPWADGTIFWDHGDINQQGRIGIAGGEAYLNTWQHWAFIIDSVNNNRRVLLNGETLGIYVQYEPYAPVDQSFYIGWWNFPSQYKWPGRVGEFRIWSTARTDAQLKTNAQVLLSQPQPGLLACWRLDDNVPVGGQLLDRSGNNYHGILR